MYTKDVVIYSTKRKQFVALDTASGGEPYYVPNLAHGARIWNVDESRGDEALASYMKVCKRQVEADGWTVLPLYIGQGE